MWVPAAPLGPTQPYASSTIGWFSTSRPERPTAIYKNGGSSSWSALVQFIPTQRLGVVTLTNVGGPSQNDVPMDDLVQIQDAILGALVPLLTPNPPVCAR